MAPPRKPLASDAGADSEITSGFLEAQNNTAAAGPRPRHTAWHARSPSAVCGAFPAALVHRGHPRRSRGESQLAGRSVLGNMGRHPSWASLPPALVVAGFTLFWTFSPSLGTPLFYYQMDILHFSREFIGLLTSLASAAIAGALAYAAISRGMPLKRMVQMAIGIGDRRGSRIHPPCRSAAYLLAPRWVSTIDWAVSCPFARW
jgi:hypothetical protein